MSDKQEKKKVKKGKKDKKSNDSPKKVLDDALTGNVEQATTSSSQQQDTTGSPTHSQQGGGGGGGGGGVVISPPCGSEDYIFSKIKVAGTNPTLGDTLGPTGCATGHSPPKDYSYDEVKFHETGEGQTDGPHTYNEVAFHEAGTAEPHSRPPQPPKDDRLSDTYEIPAGNVATSRSSTVPQPGPGYMQLNVAHQQQQPEYSSPEVGKGRNRARRALGSLSGRISSIRIREGITSSLRHPKDDGGKAGVNWMLVVMLVSTAVAVLALLFSVIALGLSAKKGGSCPCDDLRGDLGSLRAQLQNMSSSNCTRQTIASCNFSTTDLFCETLPMTVEIQPRGIANSLGCGVQLVDSVRVEDNFFFFATLLEGGDGLYSCQCYTSSSNNSSVNGSDTASRDIRCNMVATRCVM